MIRLSPSWRRVWRRFSFQALSCSASGLALWQTGLPQEFKDFIGVERAVWILGSLLAFGLIGSVIDQPKTREPKE